tara:strand:+ start:366 stop:521 length:156 start_codon:yes stop_codon:yes gene_type:complete
MEQFCPDDEEEDESFAYLIETTSFSLPDVRFSYGNFSHRSNLLCTLHPSPC